MMLVQLFDMIQVGTLGPWAISATGLAAQPTMLIFSVFSALVVGTTALVARAAGAGDREYASRVTRQSFVIVLILGAIITTIGIPASGSIIRLMGAEADTIGPGTAYMKIILAGAALATSLSRLVAFAITFDAVYRRNKFISISLHDSYKIEPELIKDVLNIGIPAAIEQLVMRAGTLLFARLIAGFGTLMFAAHQIAMNLESLTLVPVMAFQMATTTLVGQGLGAEKPELSEKVTNQAMLISVAVMTAVALLFFSFGQYAFYIFTDDPDVISMGSNAMRILAFSLPVTAIYFVLAGALRGAGDTKYAMYVSTVGVWGVRLLVGYLLADVLGLALVGAWTAVVLDMVVRMFFALKRFFSGEWKEVIQAVPEP